MSRRKRTGSATISLFAFQDIITCVMGIMLLLTLMMSLQIAVGSVASASPEMQKLMDSIAMETAQLMQSIAELDTAVTSQTALLKSGALLDAEILAESKNQVLAEVNASEKDLQRLNMMNAASRQELDRLHDEKEAKSSERTEILSLKVENKRIQQEIEDLKSGRRVIYNAHDGQAQNCWVVELTSSADIKVGLMGQEESFQRLTSANALTKWLKQQSATGDAFMLLIKPNAAGMFDDVSSELHNLGSPFGLDLLPQMSTVLGANEGEVRP